jgi:hypothetical protein
LNFESNDEIERHCWLEHSELFYPLFALGRHREIEERKLRDLGVLCINALHAGTVDNGAFVCVSCKNRSGTPGKLFSHLFAKHLGMKFVRREEHDRWPFVLASLPLSFMEGVQKLVDDCPEQSLKENGILGEDGMRCLDCGVTFERDDLRKHFLENHLACFSEILPFEKPPSKARTGR